MKEKNSNKVAELLKKFTEFDGVSGFEWNIHAVVKDVFKEYADKIQIDKMGSVIAIREGTKKNKILLSAHLDEIGLMVTKIEKDGFLRFTTVGGFDPRILLSQEVTVHSKKMLRGIIGAKPIHLLTLEERSKVDTIEDLYIDVGYDEKTVREIVRVGDFVSIRTHFSNLKNNRYSSKAFDNRASVVVIAETFRLLRGKKLPWSVYGLCSAQEEYTGLGARTVAYKINPDVAIAIDVTQGDMPGVSEKDTYFLGKGPAIAFGPNIHNAIFERLVAVAKELEMPYQIEPVAGVTGTDAAVMQIVREGIPTALVSIPLRYMHTPVETVSCVDIQRAARLLASFIESIDELELRS